VDKETNNNTHRGGGGAGGGGKNRGKNPADFFLFFLRDKNKPGGIKNLRVSVGGRGGGGGASLYFTGGGGGPVE